MHDSENRGATEWEFADPCSSPEGSLNIESFWFRLVSEGNVLLSATIPDNLTMSASGDIKFRKAFLAPTLFIELAGSANFGCIGSGLDFGLREEMYKRWILTGDVKSNSLEKRSIKPMNSNIQPQKYQNISKSEKQIDLWQAVSNSPQNSSLRSRLDMTSSNTSIPIIGLIPSKDLMKAGVYQNFDDLQGFLSSFDGFHHFRMHKWKDGILLLAYPEWMLNQDAVVPSKSHILLVKALGSSNGAGTLEAICKVFVSCTSNQWKSLMDVFPELTMVNSNTDLFKFSASNPSIFRQEGLIIDDAIMEQVASILPTLRNASPGGNRKMRWKTIVLKQENISLLVFTLETTDFKGFWKPFSSGSYSYKLQPLQFDNDK